MTLAPVYGFSPDGLAPAPYPAVLQFPGVPMLTGGFGAAIGLDQGGQSVNVGVGLAPGVTNPVTVNLGFAAGVLNVDAPGVSGSLDGGYSPYGLALNASLPPLLTQDHPGGVFPADPAWGIYDKDNQRIAAWDSVIKVDYRHEMKIADFPIEQGNFASYNKVQVPYDMKISFAVGSGKGASARALFLSQLEFAVTSLEFYKVITPEAVYDKANLTHLEYSREARRGVNLLVAEVWVQEVRPTTGDSFTHTEGITNPRSAAATDANNNGAVQATPAPPPTAADLTGLDDSGNQMILEPMPSLGAAGVPAGPPPAMPLTSKPSLPSQVPPTELNAVPGFGTIM